MEIERRLLKATEVRATGSGNALKLQGYAAIYNSPTQLPGFREQVKPGAFDKAVNGDVVALWNHNADIPLGRTTAGTLHLASDARGLRYEIDLPNTQSAREYYESVRRGDVSGSSFGFVVADGGKGQVWSEGRASDGSYFVQRDLTDVTLLDVSPVTYPAYKDTSATIARSIEIPAELRSAVDAKNGIAVPRRMKWINKRSRVFVPSLETCLEITARATSRHQREQDQAIVARRKALLNRILSD